MSVDDREEGVNGEPDRTPRLSWMELQGLLQNPIAFHRIFATIGGGAMPGLFLSQCFYWTRITTDPEGWFYKSTKDWEKETALTRTEQETCRKRLGARKLLETDLRGVPATLHYRLNRYEVLLAIESALLALPDETAGYVKSQFAGNPQTQFAEKLQTGLQEPSRLVRGKPTSKVARKPQTLSTETREEKKEENTPERPNDNFKNSSKKNGPTATTKEVALRAAQRAYDKLTPANRAFIDTQVEGAGHDLQLVMKKYFDYEYVGELRAIEREGT